MRSAVLCLLGVSAWLVGLVLLIGFDDVVPRVVAIALIAVGVPFAIFGGRGLRAQRDD